MFGRRQGALFLTLMDEKPNIELIRLLLARLERVSADSYWAHRASGIRGALLREVEALERDQPYQNPKLDLLIVEGFEILEQAASNSHPGT